MSIFLVLLLIGSVTAATSSGPTPWSYLFNFPTACSSGFAINQLNKTTTCVFSGLYDASYNQNMQGKNITNVSTITINNPPAECVLTNSFMTQFYGINQTCRTVDYLNFPYLKILAGGNITAPTEFITTSTITTLNVSGNFTLPLNSFPTCASGLEGNIRMNTTSHHPMYCNSSAWVQI